MKMLVAEIADEYNIKNAHREVVNSKSIYKI